MVRVLDNSRKVLEDEKDYEDLQPIAGREIRELCKTYPGLLVFPHSLGDCHDGIGDNFVFSLQREKNGSVVRTYNMMGFVGWGNTQLTIGSRFTGDDESRDYLLYYMLEKVFSINIFKFDQACRSEGIWDFLLLCLFPYFLNKAVAQGVYKEYRRREYNDANIRGVIDINRHIGQNIPFQGNIAYSTREYTYDNPVMQLLRHTIEHIRNHPFGRGILTSDSETRSNVSMICNITQMVYKKNLRQGVILQNLRQVKHPYFSQYADLQKICVRILRREKTAFGDSKDKLSGLLFDGAWLWEEYLNTILKKDFIHPENKKRKGGYYLFTDDSRKKEVQKIYPDFVSREGKKPVVVGDAKYNSLDRKEDYSENSERATSIYYKTLTYMYRLKSNLGMLLFPSRGDPFEEIYTIKDTEGKLLKLGFPIPQRSSGFDDFKKMMQDNEVKLNTSINNYIRNHSDLTA